MSLRTVTPWERATNWSLHIGAYVIIGLITWPLPLWQYLLAMVCVAVASSAASWRARNGEEP